MDIKSFLIGVALVANYFAYEELRNKIKSIDDVKMSKHDCLGARCVANPYYGQMSHRDYIEKYGQGITITC